MARIPHAGRKGSTSGWNLTIELVGFNVLIEDGYAAAELIPILAYQVTELAGELVRDSAIADRPWKDKTTDTRVSMEGDPIMETSGDSIIANMGPTTIYSRFLEFGWQKGGKFHHFPFMIPASDKHEIDFVNGLIDAVGIALGERHGVMGAPMNQSSQMNSTISRFRGRLYKFEKAMGDIIVITGSRYLGPARGVMLTIAKELGDLQAIMNHSVGTRVSTRITGAVTGRALGYTRSVSVSKTYSGYPGGGDSPSVGSRVYNRVAGRATRPLATHGF